MKWDETSKRLYETGVDRGAVFPMKADGSYDKGYAWNGLTGVTESPSGAEETKLYADNIKYLSLLSAEDFGLTIEAYTYPDEFEECDGTQEISTGVTIAQQARKGFGFTYRTLIGNDVQEAGTYGYMLHLVYGCKASPSEKSRSTVNDSPEATTFSWTVNTSPVNVKDHKPTAHLTIDSTKVSAEALAAFEKKLYGDDDNNIDGEFLLPEQVAAFFENF